MSIPSVNTSLTTVLSTVQFENTGRPANASPVTDTKGSQTVGTQSASTEARSLSSQTNAVREDELKDAVKKANQTINFLRSNLQFTVDEATGIDVVKFIDVQTKEVIRQIPSKEMLAIARRLDELTGMLIRDKA